MTADDLGLLIRAAEGAAELAQRYFRADPKTWEKADKSMVTEADIAVDTYLRETLVSARPDYGWMSEETPDDPAGRAGDVTFIVDPIDGTRAFAAGDPGWAHSLAITRNGVVTEAVVFLPMRGKLYAAAKGCGAHLNGTSLKVSAADAPDGATLLAGRAVTDPAVWDGAPPKFERHFRPALAYRLALIAEGRFDALLTLHPAWEWDIAAGSLLVSEAGGRASPPGQEFHRFNSHERRAPAFLAAGPALHAAIGRRLVRPTRPLPGAG